jgi:hypothetical protein
MRERLDCCLPFSFDISHVARGIGELAEPFELTQAS